MREGYSLTRSSVVPVLVALAAVAAVTLGIVVTPETAGAQETTPKSAPNIDATSWILTDEDSGRVLASKNPDEQVAPGSTTKIMVALVALDEGVNLDDEVTVSENAASYAGYIYSNVGLYPYDRVSVRELMQAALIPSGTDAVYALCEYLGGGSVQSCIQKMNQKAKELNLKNTHYDNPAGIDSPDDYTSARDLAIIAREAMKYPFFARTVATKDASITTESTLNRTIEFSNTNLLLNTYAPATGIKTGTTPDGGASLVSSAESGDESYIAVVLDAPTDPVRFGGSEQVLEYGFGSFDRRALVKKDKVYDTVTLPYRRDESRELVAASDAVGLVGPGTEVKRQVRVGDPPSEANTGDKMGEVNLFIDGQKVKSVPLVLSEGYDGASFWDHVQYITVGAARATWNFFDERM